MMISIGPSLLSANFANLTEDIRSIENGGADFLHIDMMDGHFVPNLTFGIPVISKLRPITKLPFDAHLMVEHPENYIADLAQAGVQYVTVHQEAVPHLDRVLNQIHEAGMKCGVALNPSTPVDTLTDVAYLLDLILIMSVNPGFGGQKFISHSLAKIKTAKVLLDSVGNNKAVIEVDGGINADTAPLVVAQGASFLVAGSFVFGSTDRQRAITALR